MKIYYRNKDQRLVVKNVGPYLYFKFKERRWWIFWKVIKRIAISFDMQIPSTPDALMFYPRVDNFTFLGMPTEFRTELYCHWDRINFINTQWSLIDQKKVDENIYKNILKSLSN